MGIESSFYVQRNTAIEMLLEKGINAQCEFNDKLAELLYEYGDSIFENYIVVDSLPVNEERIKEYW